MKKLFIAVAVVISCLSLNGCARTISPNVYDGQEVGSARKAVPGVIIGKRAVCIDNRTGVGGAAGVATGAVAGSHIGGSCAGSVAGAVGGAIVAGIIGNEIDKAMNHHPGFEYVVKLGHGRIISVVQTQDMQFCVHQPVLVIFGGCDGRTRIVPRDC